MLQLLLQITPSYADTTCDTHSLKLRVKALITCVDKVYTCYQYFFLVPEISLSIVTVSHFN